MKVAIQGIKGSYHHQAAHMLYGDVELIECMSFKELAMHVASGSADKGVMAIGNSIAGTILPNYSLILHHNLEFHGELYLDIEHALMALPGQSIDDIVEVQSHPMALLQCHPFFKAYPHIKLVETDDTAAAAQRIAQGQIAGVAAIAGAHAAPMYGLELLATSIQETTNNSTRFVTVEKRKSTTDIIKSDADKATINFVTFHQVGSLATVLRMLADLEINLSKIQSIPIAAQPFLFSFVADLEFNHIDHFMAAQHKLETMVQSVQIIGIYKKAAL